MSKIEPLNIIKKLFYAIFIMFRRIKRYYQIKIRRLRSMEICLYNFNIICSKL